MNYSLLGGLQIIKSNILCSLFHTNLMFALTLNLFGVLRMTLILSDFLFIFIKTITFLKH